MGNKVFGDLASAVSALDYACTVLELNVVEVLAVQGHLDRRSIPVLR